MKRILVVHFAGDFREAWQRLQRDGSERYYGHAYILGELERLHQAHGAAGYLSCLAPHYRETLPNGVTVMGADADPGRKLRQVVEQIEHFAPTHLIVHGPMQPLLRWALRQEFALACLFADSFAQHPLYRWLRFRRLPALLGDPRVAFVANHGVNAARGLVDLGVDAGKVIPWDFPHRNTPDHHAVKHAPGRLVPCLLYVGSLEPKKGVGDLIRAVAALAPDCPAHLDVVGAGQRQRFEDLAARIGVSERVRFHGLVPNAQVHEMMAQADAIVVPSRHAFPEGLPLTLYEALASRTPTIASDHPMFAGHLEHGTSAAIFPAGNVQALAQTIGEVLGNRALYAQLSQGSRLAWNHMQVAVKWGDLIDRWVSGQPEDIAWLAANSIGASDANGRAGTAGLKPKVPDAEMARK